MKRARKLKIEHLKAMVQGQYDEAYVEERLQMGLLYSRAGLDTRAFLGAFHNLLRAVALRTTDGAGLNETRPFDPFMSFMKVAFFDIGLIIDTLVYERERTIKLQQDAIRELSTPVLKLGEGLLILPIVGMIDTTRASQIIDELLVAVRKNRARAVVMDITGVPMTDTRIAHHIAHAVRTSALMGARTVLTGLSDQVAHSLVQQGVNLGHFETYASLQDGVEAVQSI
ncbi:MAG: STAS domain-containing protein [Gammaproteobacteria bacterium]